MKNTFLSSMILPHLSFGQNYQLSTQKAKRVIFLDMGGSPSQYDTFYYRPKLKQYDKKSISLQRSSGESYNINLLASPFQFTQRGESGAYVSELFPHIGKHVDKMTFIHSMNTDIPAHAQAQKQLHTGFFQFNRPSMSSWIAYGLGSGNLTLPTAIAIDGGAKNFSSSVFLPASCNSLQINTRTEKLPDIQRIDSRELQKLKLDIIGQLTKIHKANDYDNSQADALIQNHELAYKMQEALPKVMNLNDESSRIRDSYGINNSGFAKGCLLARRFIEQDVRFVRVRSNNWDHHRNLTAQITGKAKEIDQPIAALLADLEQKKLLDDTLVIWGGEFGRTPNVQAGQTDGRNHQHKAFTMWLAGGGIKKGFTYGETDELGMKITKDGVHVTDLHATILHLLGLDHEKLTYRYSGRDMRLTDTQAEVIHNLIG